MSHHCSFDSVAVAVAAAAALLLVLCLSQLLRRSPPPARITRLSARAGNASIRAGCAMATGTAGLGPTRRTATVSRGSGAGWRLAGGQAG